MKEALFTVGMSVRDYECDMQGIVNNAVFQNYLETARHDFLLSRDVDFADLIARGVIVIVTRAELDYKKPLR
jgi:acyl-CoA thioester hydrolase